MKNKNFFLIFLIIFLSSLSWFFWWYYFISNNLNLDNFNNNSSNHLDLENKVINVVDNVSAGVVNIIIKKDITLYRRDPWWFFQRPIWNVEKTIWWWSWFFISKDWIIITNKHVVSDKNAKYIVITNSWEEYESSVLAIDNNTDLALIKIDNSKKDFFALDIIENESEIKIWQFAIAIWNALAEFKNSVSLWVISWRNRTIEAWNFYESQKLTWLLQTDAAINPWNSWWPLISLSWKVVWINTAIAWNSQWIWFAIPLTKNRIDFILNFINENY